MIRDVALTLFNVRDAENLPEKLIRRELAVKLDCTEKEINAFVLKKKSLDARHGKVKFHLRFQVFTGTDFPDAATDAPPEYKPCDKNASRVVVVGSGPAGLFAALKLIETGIVPVVLERGKPAPQRKRDIAAISTRQHLDPDSNYCFGEGGAGTFSDGKLYTRSNKRGNLQRILRIFHHFGADPQILTEAHPHIGTDKLPTVIQAMTAKIRECGGEVHFGCCCTELLFGDDEADGRRRVVGVRAVTVAEPDSDSRPPTNSDSPSDSGSTSSFESPSDSESPSSSESVANVKSVFRDFFADAVILAAGHSATDIYQLLVRQLPAALEDKTFAMGVRVEHPRSVIDDIQFHGAQKKSDLGAAEYRLVTQAAERGVYSFCMCPGGLVVPSASCSGGLVVNGMSPSSRGGKWSNAAIVVEIRPEDFELLIAQLEEKLAAVGVNLQDGLAACGLDSAQWLDGGNLPSGGEFSLSKGKSVHGGNLPSGRGLYLRTLLEMLAKAHGQGQQAPAQLLADFLARRASVSLPQSTYTPGLVASRLDQWLPPYLCRRLQAAFADFDKKMRGFVCPQALLIAAETRTSTPVRIARNSTTLECVAAAGLYPAGEGAGYSGGIVSSAMDGETVAAAVIGKFSVFKSQ